MSAAAPRPGAFALARDTMEGAVRNVRAFPSYMLPALIALGAGLYLVNLREAHFEQALQLLVGWIYVGLLILLRVLPGSRKPPLRFVFIALAGFLTLRYFWWRSFETLIYTRPVDFVGMALLYLAECYSVTVHLLGLFVNLWPLERPAAVLPEDRASWPTVDVFIPTYSEDVSIVEVTALAATQIDYPKEKLRVFILDDGGTLAKRRDPAQAAKAWDRRYRLMEIARSIGVEYLTRETNKHAKAGNLNHALDFSSGDLILFLDCDHIPAQDILTRTAGHFLNDPKLFLVQTPHFFANAAPAERSMGAGRPVPDESEMFYRVIQPGLDSWNASYFCGSAAIMRRSCLEAIGGLSGRSITEDAETAFELHRAGYNSLYVSRPMVCGLSAESYADYMLQHTRWAQGMVQIFLMHNPVFGRGLTVAQRLCYLNCFLFWFFGLARLAYFLAPAAFLVFGMSIYHASAEQVLAYAAPFVISTFIVSDFLFGISRRAFFSEIYESVQSAFLAPAVLDTLRHPNRPTFKVTPKGMGLREERLSTLSFAFFAVLAVNLAAAAAGGWRIFTQPDYRDVIAVTLFWSVYNIYLAVVSLGALWERRQVRAHHRFHVEGKVTVTFPRLRESVEATLVDLSLTGVGFTGTFPFEVKDRERVELASEGAGGRVFRFEARVHRVAQKNGLVFCGAEFIVPEGAFAEVVAFVYGDSRRWLQVWASREKGLPFVVSLWYLAGMGLRGGWVCLAMVSKAVYVAIRGIVLPAKAAVDLTRKVAPTVLRQVRMRTARVL
jgi:cellulose synthase (UDP-forming)